MKKESVSEGEIEFLLETPNKNVDKNYLFNKINNFHEIIENKINSNKKNNNLKIQMEYISPVKKNEFFFNNENTEKPILIFDYLENTYQRNKSRFSSNLNNFDLKGLEIINSQNNYQNKINNFKNLSLISKSYFCLLISIFFRSIFFLLIKVLILSINMNPSVNVIIFNLNFCQIFFSIIFIKIEHIDLENQKVFNLNQIDELIMKGVMNYCLNIFIIYSLVYNNYLNTIVFFYLSPIILSYIYLKQKMDNIKKIEKKNYLLALLVCIIFFIKNFKGTFFSIFSSILLALNQLIDPKTCNNYHPYIINFVSNAIGLIITPILMSINNDLFTIGYCENLLFFILSFCSFYSFYYKQKSIQFNQNIYRSNFNYISIILGYFYSFFILKEKIDILIVIGSIMIIFINYYTKISIAENEDDK